MLLFTIYPYTPIKSSFEDAGSVEDMMRCSKLPCHDLTLSVSEPENAAAQTGAGTSFGAKGDQHTRAAELSTYFCVLTIWKHLLNLSGRGPSICYRRPFCRLKAPLGLSLLRYAAQTRSMRFERSGRGQEPSRGHKFSILENLCSTGTSLLQCICISEVILLG